jgi:hypothetical protein
MRFLTLVTGAALLATGSGALASIGPATMTQTTDLVAGLSLDIAHDRPVAAVTNEPEAPLVRTAGRNGP